MSGKTAGEPSYSIRGFRAVHIDPKHPRNKKFFDQLALKTETIKNDLYLVKSIRGADARPAKAERTLIRD